MDLGRGQVDVPLGLSLTMGTGEKDIRVVSEMWVDNFTSSVSSTGVWQFTHIKNRFRSLTNVMKKNPVWVIFFL